jgi:hypothetical protein
MLSRNSGFPLGIGNFENPLTNSLFNERSEFSNISPGSPQFIVTENFIRITTEDGKQLITEG